MNQCESHDDCPKGHLCVDYINTIMDDDGDALLSLEGTACGTMEDTGCTRPDGDGWAR